MTSSDDNDLASVLIGHLASLYNDSEICPEAGWEVAIHDAVESALAEAKQSIREEFDDRMAAAIARGVMQAKKAMKSRRGSSATQASIAKEGE